MDPFSSPLSLSHSGFIPILNEKEMELYTEMTDHPSFMEITDEDVENRLREIHGIGCYILHSGIPSYTILSTKSVAGQIEHICFKLSETVKEDGDKEYPSIEKAIAKRIQGLVSVKEIEALVTQKTKKAINLSPVYCDISQEDAEYKLKGRSPGTYLLMPHTKDDFFRLNYVQENGLIGSLSLYIDRHGFIKCGPHKSKTIEAFMQELSMPLIPYTCQENLIHILRKTNAFIPLCDQPAAEEKLIRLSEVQLPCFLFRLDPENEEGFILSYIADDGVQHVKFYYSEKCITVVGFEEGAGYLSIDSLIQDYILDALIPIHEAKNKRVLGLDCLDMKKEYESLPGMDETKLAILKKLYSKMQKGNRYGNIFPFPENMVCLQSNKYIHASRLAPENGEAYICTQGPICDIYSNTLNEFWEMVWQEDVPVIIMVTNLSERYKEKCAQYWPLAGVLTYGEITVTIIEEQVRYSSACTEAEEGLTLRTFKLERNQETKFVHQLKFENWTDFGVGNVQLVSQMIDDANKLRNMMHANNKSLLVHCSAGVGRSGTFIAVHHLIRYIEAALAMGEITNVNVKETVIDLRNEKTGRMGLVQSPEQYALIYKILQFRYKGNV